MCVRTVFRCITGSRTGSSGITATALNSVAQLGIFWPANFRPIPNEDCAGGAYKAIKTENREGESDFLYYSYCQHEKKCHICFPIARAAEAEQEKKNVG
jgi:hypothetical protein